LFVLGGITSCQGMTPKMPDFPNMKCHNAYVQETVIQGECVWQRA
jgi:hypothetical protein